jgi:hypothetical protein
VETGIARIAHRKLTRRTDKLILWPFELLFANGTIWFIFGHFVIDQTGLAVWIVQ